MLAIFVIVPPVAGTHQGQALRALSRLQEHVVGAGEQTFPGNGFGKRGFVKNILVQKACGKHEEISSARPATDELIFHVGFV